MNIVQAAFTAMARTDAGETTPASYSFAVVNGEAVYRGSWTTTCGDDAMQDGGGEGECECKEVDFYCGNE